MTKAIALLAAVSMILISFAVLTTPAAAHQEDDPYTVDLLAGKNIDVGNMEVWNDGEYLYVTYVIEDTTPDDSSDDWFITETHLAVEEYLSDIPQTKKNNVKVGHFEFKGEHDYITEYTYEIELDWDFDTDLFIAAHAVVEQMDGSEETAWGEGDRFNNKNWAMYFGYTVQDYVCPVIFAPTDGAQVITGQTLLSDKADMDLSGTVHIMVKYPYANAPSYFMIYIDTDGEYATNDLSTWEHAVEGWCVDIDHVIYQWTAYEVDVYECGDEVPTDVVDNPENIPYVQHILDQDWVGQTSAGGYGTYTYGDVQRAIWEVIDDSQSTNGLGAWNQNRVNEILTDAGYL